MNIQEITALVGEDFSKTNTLIHQSLGCELPLIENIGNYIVDNGGKRLRPLMVLLMSNALGYKGSFHIHTAAIVELIHTATLMHDDVVDKSSLRRGHKTANNIWGNAISVLTGDFLYSRAFQLMVTINDMRVLDVLANASNLIATGEVEQLAYCHNANTTLDHYLSVIEKKTAKLFEAACRLPAILQNTNPVLESQCANYGKLIGIAFQLIDDVMDYTADETTMGKHIGDDLAEGKPTMPMIHALKKGSPTQCKILTSAITEGKTTQLNDIITILYELGSISFTHQQTEKYIALAIDNLASLPQSDYRDALISLANHTASRVS